jgi:nucleoside-diphosphate-sugar epimerase
MRVFIAGATGVIGRSLIPMLRMRGHTIRGLTTKREGGALLQELGAQPVIGNLLHAQSSSLAEWIDGCDAVVHVATALGKHPEAPSAQTLQRTGALRTHGSRVLLQAALDFGVRKYVQESIELAYPDNGDAWIDESHALDASPERAIVCAPVIEMEAAVSAANSAELRCCVLRGGRFIGAGTGQDNALAALRSGTLRIAGDGSNFISPVHVDDYARAIVLAVEAPNPPPVLNINTEPVRERAYYDLLADAIGAPRPVSDSHRATPPSHRCSAGLARSSLGWTTEEPLVEQTR